MKTHQRFLITIFVFFLCLAPFSPLIAQGIEEKLPAIVKRIETSTVVILTYDGKGNLLTNGSGFFISQDGDVITNRHVIMDASRAEVKTAEGKVYPITQVLAEDKEGDIIRVSVDIPQKEVKPLSVGVSVPEVGERIIVIGNPLGLERTVSDGIVSAVRDVPNFGNIIQITAPISPGSSGSPVVNMKGEVIGVATFQLMEGQNLNFVIPSERIAKLKQDKGKTLAEWQLQTSEEWLASAEGLYYTGLISLWGGDYENGLFYFEKAVKKNPRHADAYFYIGYCNDKLGRYSEAVEACKQAIRINLDFAEAHFYLGVAYDGLGRHSEAVEAFKQAIRINPDYAEAHYNLGVAYGKLGRYSEAVEACKQAIRINPDFAEAHLGLGFTYYKLGRYIEAVEAYKQAIRINPDYAEAHYNLGGAYDKLGRYSEAVEAYKQAIRINPDLAEAHCNLGVAYYKLGRYSEAVEAFKQAIRINPDLAMAHCNLGVDYYELGRYSEAVEAFKQAIRINPDYADAHLGLGVTYFIVGNNDSALEEYRILKELDRDLANKLFNMIYE